MAAEWRVRAGRAGDFPAVLAINTPATPHVGVLTPEELAELAGIDGCFLVADAAGEVVGYLLAIAPDAAYDGEEFLRLRASVPSSLYVDQLVVAEAWRRRGIGAALYEEAAAVARRRGLRHLTCEVNLRPPNPRSLRFHWRLGFREIGTMAVADGRLVSLQVRDVGPAPRASGPG